MSLEEKTEEFSEQVAEFKAVLVAVTPVIEKAIADVEPDLEKLLGVVGPALGRVTASYLVPVVIEVIRGLKEVQAVSVEAESEYFAQLYRILMDKGFSDEAAMTIVVARAGRGL